MAYFADVQAKAAQELRKQNVAEHPRIACWQAAFADLGINPRKYPPAISGLAERVCQGRKLSYISTLVAGFNLVSLKYLLPCGGDDLDKVEGNLYLKAAAGEESFTPFNSRVVEHPHAGEIIYVDDAGMVLCRRWCWRQGDKTKLTQNTRNVAINLDLLTPVTRQEAETAVTELAELIEKYCGGRISSYWLSVNNPQAEIWH
jgi:lysyl-tRNA synthetase class 2